MSDNNKKTAVLPSKYKRKNSSMQLIGIMCFFMLLTIITIIGLIIPIRPDVSETEKRKLTEFPKLTADTFTSGEYFSQISLWYSDTYPFRDTLTKTQSIIASIKGLHTETLTGPIQSADEIPSIPLVTNPGGQGLPSSLVAFESELNVPTSGSVVFESFSIPDPTASSEPVVETTSSTVPTDQPVLPPDGPSDISEQAPIDPTVTEPPVTEAPPAPTEPPATEAPPAPTEPPTVAPTTVTPTLPPVVYKPGQVETIGSIYVLGNTGFDLYYFSLKTANEYIAVMNKAASILGDKCQIYNILVPNASSVMLSPEQLASLGCSSVSDALAYASGSMDPRIKCLNIYPTLLSHNSEYLFFRTDHHWTALGAYYAYLEWTVAAGVPAVPLEYYQQVEYPGFLGTFYSSSGQSPALGATPDTVIAYIPPDTNNLRFMDTSGTWWNWRVINDVSTYTSINKYSTFIAADQPFEIIENPNNPNGKVCIVYKDSYGNPFVPNLIHHYKTVYVVDPRYYTISLPTFVNENGVDDIFFINSIEFLASNFASLLDANLS